MSMALPQSIDTGMDAATAQVLGWRAQWLRLRLLGRAASAMTHRDRALLTLVAINPTGIAVVQLVDALLVVGINQHSGVNRVSQMVEEGWLSHCDGVVDLPAADVAWIAAQVSQP